MNSHEHIHPRLAKLKSIRFRNKKHMISGFGYISYYERLQYSECLIDWMTCGLIPKLIPDEQLT